MTGKHILGRHVRETPRVLFGDLPSNADCLCRSMKARICPRHDAATYADSMAVHATDSISGSHGQRFA